MNVSFNRVFNCFNFNSVIKIISEFIIDRSQVMHSLFQLRFGLIFSRAFSIHALIFSLQYRRGNSLDTRLAFSSYIPFYWLISIYYCFLCHIVLHCTCFFSWCNWYKAPFFVIVSFSYYSSSTWSFDARIYMNWHRFILNDFKLLSLYTTDELQIISLNYY